MRVQKEGGRLCSVDKTNILEVTELWHEVLSDIAGKNVVIPMMLRYSLNLPEMALKIEKAVGKVLDKGFRNADFCLLGNTKLSTSEMGAAILEALE